MKNYSIFTISAALLAGCTYNRFCELPIQPAPVAPVQPAVIVTEPADPCLYTKQCIAEPAPVAAVRTAAPAAKPAVKKAVAKPKPVVKKKAKPKPKPVPVDTCPTDSNGDDVIMIKRIRTAQDGTQTVVSDYQEYIPKK